MSPNDTARGLISVYGYTIPKYHPGVKAYVDFYAVDYSDGKVKRKKYHIDSIKKPRERRQFAERLIADLHKKLADGWRPWGEARKSQKCYTPVEECCKIYLSHISKIGRKKTIHSYTSRVNILLKYLSTLEPTPKYIIELDRKVIVAFLDWILEVRNNTPRTRNNYRDWCVVFFDYMQERGYISENPAVSIDKIIEKKKKRQSIPPEILHRVFEHLKKEDPYFLLAVMMEYYTFIRPTELTHLRLRDISIKEQRIFVSGDYSKNKNDAFVALNKSIIKQMIELKIFDCPDDFYIFGRDFRPGDKASLPDIFNKRWARMRAKLCISDVYQFYSLKDSGIRDLANTAGIVVARDQARHSDVSTTNKYLQGRSMTVSQEAKDFEGSLS